VIIIQAILRALFALPDSILFLLCVIFAVTLLKAFSPLLYPEPFQDGTSLTYLNLLLPLFCHSSPPLNHQFRLFTLKSFSSTSQVLVLWPQLNILHSLTLLSSSGDAQLMNSCFSFPLYFLSLLHTVKIASKPAFTTHCLQRGFSVQRNIFISFHVALCSFPNPVYSSPLVHFFATDFPYFSTDLGHLLPPH